MLGFRKTYSLATENHTKLLAQSLAKIAKKGDIFLLKGDLGSGKTAFSRFFIQSFLGDQEEVPSPTFTILQTYFAKEFVIWHLDLYRIKDSSELIELGIEDALYGGVSLIEWPERLGVYKPKSFLSLLFDMEQEKRTVTIDAFGEWDKRLNDF